MGASQRKVEVSTHACMPLDPSTARMHTSHTQQHRNAALPPPVGAPSMLLSFPVRRPLPHDRAVSAALSSLSLTLLLLSV